MTDAPTKPYAFVECSGCGAHFDLPTKADMQEPRYTNQLEAAGWRRSISTWHGFPYGDPRRSKVRWHCPKEECRPSKLSRVMKGPPPWSDDEEDEKNG